MKISAPGPSLLGGSATLQHRTVGGVFFRRLSTGFLPLVWQDKWENWERQCVHGGGQSLLHLRLPQGPSVSNARCAELPVMGAAWSPVLERINSLWAVGLNATMVVADFFRHFLAPLQAHPHQHVRPPSIARWQA